MSDLEKQLDKEMRSIYYECKKFGYSPKKLKTMLESDGAILTAINLIMRSDATEGFKRLSKEDRLDLSVEALICENPKFHKLFKDPEALVEKARKNLRKYEYTPKTS